MAKGRTKKKKSSGLHFSQTMIKYLLFIVIGSFFLSGLFWDIGADNPQDANTARPGWNVVEYENAQLSTESGIASIVAKTANFKLVPRNPAMVSSNDLERAFNSEIKGVLSVVYEFSPTNPMFHLTTDGTVGEETIRNQLSISGGYDLFEVYEASSAAGPLKVVGRDLEPKGSVKVLLLSRSRDGIDDMLGFYQSAIVEGPVIDATAVSFEWWAFESVHPARTLEGAITAIAENATRISVPYINDTKMYGASFAIPLVEDPDAIQKDFEDEGYLDVSYKKFGWADAPDSMSLGGQLFEIPKTDGFLQATFSPDTEANDSVRLAVYPMMFGDTVIVYAIEVEENGTAPQ